MGATISNLINSYENDDAKRKLANDVLHPFYRLCQLTESSFFGQAVRYPMDDTSGKLLPIDKVNVIASRVYCNYQADPQITAEYVKYAIGPYVKKDLWPGLTTHAIKALDTLISSTSGTMNETQGYVVAVGSQGGIVRINYSLLYFKFESEAVREVCQSAIVQATIVSYVKVDDLDLKTLNAAIKHTFCPGRDEKEEDYVKRLETVQNMAEEELVNLKKEKAAAAKNADVAADGASG